MPRQALRQFGGSILNANNTPSVSVADSASLRPAGSKLSVEVWVCPSFIRANDYNVIAAKVVDATWANGGWALYFDGAGSLKFFINHYIAGGTYTGNGKLRQHRWQHLVGVYDGAMLRIYIDGVQSGAGAAYSTPITHSVGYLGIGAAQGALFHASNIAEVRVYGRALSAGEIAIRRADGREVAREELCGEWNFADVSGTSCPDRSGNGNTATLFSAAMAATASPMKARSELARVAAARAESGARSAA